MDDANRRQIALGIGPDRLGGPSDRERVMQRRMGLAGSSIRWIGMVVLAFVWLAHAGSAFQPEPTEPTMNEAIRELPLESGWTIEPVSGGGPFPISLGDSWEKVLGRDFDGKAIYRCKLPTIDPQQIAQRRIWIELDGVATHAILRVEGKQVGEHLGAWTCWRVDLTAWYRPGLEIQVEVDERVGHNTQGFLPVFLPHFGGIWKTARLLLTPAGGWVDRKASLVAGWSDRDQIDLQLEGYGGTAPLPLEAGARVLTEKGWTPWQWQPVDWTPVSLSPPGTPQETEPSAQARWKCDMGIAIEQPRRWSPEDPYRYRVQIALSDREGRTLHRLETQASLRSIAAQGNQLLLNGKPLTVRGVLNWGYAPPRIAPSLDPQVQRREIEQARSMGFNLIKFCLWVPPESYLQQCDELGMLAWVEYPTWHPQLKPKFQSELLREYDEFFRADRNHPSVILRSLTCETGPSADLEVLRSLYDLGHARIPGALIEDDSSWIQWNRICDFYDDHPYGNSHDWLARLDQLDNHLQGRDPKPLLLGEAIAADTWGQATPWPDWPSSHPLASSSEDAPPVSPSPHHLRSIGAQSDYLDWIDRHCGPQARHRLSRDASDQAMQMRRFQIELYRRRMPGQGYVVSVLRDFPFANMGLLDAEGHAKWDPSLWDWHRDAMGLLETPGDRRAITSGQPAQIRLRHTTLDSHPDVQLACRWRLGDSPETSPWTPATAMTNEAAEDGWRWDQLAPSVPLPTKVQLEARWTAPGMPPLENRWDLWILPPLLEENDPKGPWARHSSLPLGDPALDAWTQPLLEWSPGLAANVITTRLDQDLVDHLAAGGRCLMLADGGTGSFRRADHWFLRGGPVVGKSLEQWSQLRGFPVELVTSLQPLDLGAPVIPKPLFLNQTDPWLLLWDNHDLDHYRTHALVFRCQVGKGQLLVSSLEHRKQSLPAGQWLLRELATAISKFPGAAEEETFWKDHLQNDLKATRVRLPATGWKFQPDPEGVGTKDGWYQPDWDDANWSAIEIEKPWDGQGYAALDGEAWYRRQVTCPKGARFLKIEGADDYAEVYLNGQRLGSMGDRQTKKTAFEQTAWFPIPSSLLDRPESVVLTIRVEDWQGGGGLFRPISWTSHNSLDDEPILVGASP
ncbi:MAG: glycoside hydrolase family 2 TIM barrel-domain containing protein [Pirellulaceae bacterium]